MSACTCVLKSDFTFAASITVNWFVPSANTCIVDKLNNCTVVSASTCPVPKRDT